MSIRWISTLSLHFFLHIYDRAFRHLKIFREFPRDGKKTTGILFTFSVILHVDTFNYETFENALLQPRLAGALN